MALLGGRYIGKTFLLQKFMADHEGKDVVFLYLELEHKDFRYFADKFIASLLYNYSKIQNLALYQDIPLLIESLKKTLPQTIEQIKNVQESLDKGKTLEAYQHLLSLPQTFSLESNKFCVLILDEFQCLEEFEIDNVFQELGKVIMTQKRCLYIVTSSFIETAKRILAEKLSLLFGNFEIIDVLPVDIKTSQMFINYYLNTVKMGIQLKNFLVDFTGGHPLYLKLICQELLNLSAIHQQKEIFAPIFFQAVENTIFSRWGVLSRHFEDMAWNLSTKGNGVVNKMLVAVANGKHKLKELSFELGVKPSSLLQKMNRLMETGLVIKSGQIYYLPDKLFRYWLKYVFQKMFRTIDIEEDTLKQEFAEELQRLMASFNLTMGEDFLARIVGLLQCFDNDALQINGKRYKLPSLREITPVQLSKVYTNHFSLLKARCEDGSWLIVLKKDSLCETEVSASLMEAKLLGEKPSRCVIISLGELDHSAKLKALQERMWIWNEGELNTLLNFYDKPYIGL